MDKIDATCIACGTVNKVKPWAPAKDAKEKKQIAFNCTGCRAVNLKDGTAIYRKKLPPEEGAPTPKDKVKKRAPVPARIPAPEPEPVIDRKKSSAGLLVTLSCLLGVIGFTAALMRKKNKPQESPENTVKPPVDPLGNVRR